MRLTRTSLSLLALLGAFQAVAAAQTVVPKATAIQGGIFPYFADGGGWTTTFNLTCWSSTGCTMNFTFLSSNGSRQVTPVRITTSGSAGEVQTVVTDSSIDFTLQAGQGVVIETLGQSSTVATGAIDLKSSYLLVGFSTLRQSVPGRPDYEATVPMEDRNANNHFVIAFDNRNGFATGAALTNLTNNLRADVVITGVDLGNKTLFTGLISLDPLNGTAFSVADKFPATAGKVGLLNFTVQNAYISGTGFRFNPGGAFTTLPIFQVR